MASAAIVTTPQHAVEGEASGTSILAIQLLHHIEDMSSRNSNTGDGRLKTTLTLSKKKWVQEKGNKQKEVVFHTRDISKSKYKPFQTAQRLIL